MDLGSSKLLWSDNQHILIAAKGLASLWFMHALTSRASETHYTQQ